MKPLLEIRDLYKEFHMGDERVMALRGVDLTIFKGEVICLIGPSGSGKSTLLNMMAGLEKPTRGNVVIGGIHLETLSEDQLAVFRRLNVGFVFQSYNLLATLSALENVSLGLTFKGIERDRRKSMAQEILRQVGLGERLDHKPGQMSGGQQQRVSIARAFVDQPPILFADEPTGNLDTKTSFQIMDLMTHLARKNNSTLVLVTHNIETASYADRIVHFRDGQIERIEDRSGDIRP